MKWGLLVVILQTLVQMEFLVDQHVVDYCEQIPVWEVFLAILLDERNNRWRDRFGFLGLLILLLHLIVGDK